MPQFDLGSFVLGIVVAAAIWTPVIYGAIKADKKRQDDEIFSLEQSNRFLR